MSKVLHSRVFRFLVCFLLIGCILVNLSPLKAEATSVVVPTVAKLSFEALMAILYSMGIGIVATELTVGAWNKIGNSLTEAITDTGDSTITEAWIDLEAMYDSYIPGGGMDPDDELNWTEKLKTALSRGLLGAIAGWLCTLVNMGGYEVEGDTATTGWTYYGDTLLPTFPVYEARPNQFLIYTGSSYNMFSVNKQIYYDSSAGNYRCKSAYSRCQDYVNTSDLASWNINSSFDHGLDKTSEPYGYSINSYVSGTLIWSNCDILSYSDGVSLVYAGSEPTTTKTEIIEPSIYVGDIPQQIQDGEKDKDNLNLPLLDPWKLFQSPDSAFDDITQLQQQIADGTMTLDQYLEQVQVQDPTVDPDPDPTTDPSESTQPSTGTDEEWEAPTDPTGFALDLTKVFPFCIPFDLYDFLTCLNADPVAPVIQWELALPGGGSFPIELDLSPFDSVAQLLRRLQLLLFCVALAIKTRDLIKG